MLTAKARAEYLKLKQAFDENTCQVTIDGRTSVKCLKGLWEVEGPDHEHVMREARHYFYQYYQDG